MGSERDPFANFDRMRREMDELFGDVLDRGLRRRRRGFTPAVDVFHLEDPPRAVVQADLAGVQREDIELEVRGRELVLAGQRRPAEDAGGRTYQQLEIEHGPFRRVIGLGVDVDADGVRAVYANGMLRVELPVAPARPASRHVPITEDGR
jgi:HSP20 family protein